MSIQSVSSLPPRATPMESEWATVRPSARRGPSAVRADTVEFGGRVEITTYQATGQWGQVKGLSDPFRFARVRDEVDQQILDQTRQLLEKFYGEHPEAVEQVQRGEVPEYFNVKNTGTRILDIVLRTYAEGEDRKAFAEKALGLLKEAYGDAERIWGGALPDLVLQTRDAVFRAMERFGEGASLEEVYGSLEEA